MSFLSPIFLWGLPLIAVPVLIHLFGKRKREILRWGAMEFLFASATPRRRLLRLRDLLLMLLRAAAVLAIVCALAQPMLSTNRFGSAGPRDVILVLDNSLSTGRKLGAQTVFALEVAEAARLIEQLNAADRIRVLLAAPRPEWLDESSFPADASHVRSLAARLRALKPNDGAADMLECVQQAIKAAAAGKDLTKFVAVVTDGQAHGWRADVPRAWSSVEALAKKCATLTRVIVVGSGAGPVTDLAIENMAAARTMLAVGQPAALTASVKNTGTRPSEPTSVAWRSGDQALGVSMIPVLQPGAGTTVKLSQPFATPGVNEISCKLVAQDDLPADDTGHLLLDVARAVPILLVQGEPRSDPVQSDTQCFLAALGYRDDSKENSTAASAFQPKIIGYQQLASEDLAFFRCIVLANVPRLSAEVAQKLSRHVSTGGGLWIALGDQTDVRAFNQIFFERNVSLSPVHLLQPVGDAEDREKFTAVAPPAVDHPATALLADLQRLDIDRLRIYRRHQFGSESGSSVAVLLRAEGGVPVAVEKSLGRGRIIVQAFPLSLAWSNLALCHSFVVMVHEWLWYLAEPSLVKRNLQPGELLQASRPLKASDGIASLETPAGWTAQLLGQEEDGRLVFRYPKTQCPGHYDLSIPGSTENSRAEKFLVSRDPEESNLTPLSPQEIKGLSESGGLEFRSDPFYQPVGQRVAAQPKPVASWLLLGLVLLMTAEAAAAFWLARQQHSKTPGVVMGS